MGGFVAVEAAAGDPGIEAVALISAVDLGGLVPQPLPENTDPLVKGLSKGYASQGLAPLSGCTPDRLAHETIINARQWSFVSKAGALRSKPLLIVTSDDGFAPGSDALGAALRAAGDRHIVTLHFATDHSYSDDRMTLSEAVVNWLSTKYVSGNEFSRLAMFPPINDQHNIN